MKLCKTGLLFFLSLLLNTSFAQYQTQQNAPIPKRATINIFEAKNDYFPLLQNVEAPSPSGKSYRSFLERQKIKAGQLYPQQEVAIANKRNAAEPPFVTREFAGNSSNNGVPLDNHLAISNNGWIVSVVNSNIAIYDKSGNRIKGLSLSQFSDAAQTKSEFKFDPRVIYDPNEDRFVLTFISGFECANSEIVMGFSASNDPSGDWHVYVIDGCPFDDNTFADYPMFALSEKELFFTINSVKENVSWQEGFEETLIYQIDKTSGFSGSDLKSRMWSDVEFEGRNIRNVCPIKAAGQLMGTSCYLMSNRNFDIKNDTFFILQITDVLDAPDVALEIEAVSADLSYGLAPNATQKFGKLQTNDSRVLDGFLLGDQIQFVMNCIDTLRGTPAIYHGVLGGIGSEKTIKGQVLTNGKDEFGYPGIAWSGIEEDDRDAIIVLSHSSRIRNTGMSMIYFNNDGIYSDLTTLKEGRNYIDRLDENLERWGDYVGIQRRYDAPGRVWSASTYGASNKNYATWITELGRPGLDLTSVKSIRDDHKMNIFPNPANDMVRVQFELNESAIFQLRLLDVNGRVIKTFYHERPKKIGRQAFSFSTAPLNGGIYFLQVVVKGQEAFAKRLVVLK